MLEYIKHIIEKHPFFLVAFIIAYIIKTHLLYKIFSFCTKQIKKWANKCNEWIKTRRNKDIEKNSAETSADNAD
jgi:hypothetical protein